MLGPSHIHLTSILDGVDSCEWPYPSASLFSLLYKKNIYIKRRESEGGGLGCPERAEGGGIR